MGATKTEEFDLRVKDIKKYKEDSSWAVFTAAVLIWRPRKKEWVETKQIICCTGYFLGLIENDHLHVTAIEVEDPVYGFQYRIQTAQRVQPGTTVELFKLLTSIRGIGVKYAQLLIEQFGLDTISKICNHPELMDDLKLPDPTKEKLHNAIIQNQSFEKLLMFLQLHGISPKHTMELYKQYGDNAIAKIKDNPFSLYMDNVVDFSTADRLSHELGLSPDSVLRIAAALMAYLRNDADSNGNLFVPQTDLYSNLSLYLKKSSPFIQAPLSDQALSDAVAMLIRDGFIMVDYDAPDSPAVYLASIHRAEERAVHHLSAQMIMPKKINAPATMVDTALDLVQREHQIYLDPAQQAAIKTALTQPVSILTGGPGTGKSQTLALLIQTARKMFPQTIIKLCAPTGKAASRMQELTHLRASTIHRLLGYPHKMLKENELICDLLVVDEFSMCDIYLCAQLLSCVETGARILFVGDHEQLPSVGPGLVLRDLIQSGAIPVTHLTKVFRQKSGSNIIRNAHQILSPTQPNLTYSAAKGGDFYFIPAKTQSKIVKLIQKSVERLITEGFSFEQIEVLSPIHGGLIGTDSLNSLIQEMVNPSGAEYQLPNGMVLRPGDKVIHTKNNYALGVFNGETGIVSAIRYDEECVLEVKFPDRTVYYDAKATEDLELAYAITAHRSQGSEYDVVIIPVHETLLFNLNKSILYTAVTRAKKRVIFIGTQEALHAGIEKQNAVQRRSNFIPKLQSSM